MRKRRRAFLSALLACTPAAALALGSLATATAISAGPQTPREVAAVFPPWWTLPQSLAAARDAGVVAAFGGAPNVVIVVADDDGLPARLNASGALLLLDPVFTGLCGPQADPTHV